MLRPTSKSARRFLSREYLLPHRSPVRCPEMTPKIIRGFTPFGLIFVLMILASMVVGHGVANAGDQEGVAGYKFKVYDADGDGIDGNEADNYYGGGSSSSVSIDPVTYQENAIHNKSYVSLVRIIYWAIWFR